MRQVLPILSVSTSNEELKNVDTSFNGYNFIFRNLFTYFSFCLAYRASNHFIMGFSWLAYSRLFCIAAYRRNIILSTSNKESNK